MHARRPASVAIALAVASGATFLIAPAPALIAPAPTLLAPAPPKITSSGVGKVKLGKTYRSLRGQRSS